MTSLVNRLARDPLFLKTAPYQTLHRHPIGLVDAGARGEIFKEMEPLAALTAVLGFEPDLAECRRLNRELADRSPWAFVQVEPVALSSNRGAAVLHQFSGPNNNSLRPANRTVVRRYEIGTLRPAGRVRIRTAALDQILQSPGLKNRRWGEFIKLDTQGTEYEILSGARQTLSDRTVAVVTEACFFELYRGQKLFSEIELLLRAHGFDFYGFLSVHHRSKKLIDKRTEAGRERVLYSNAVFFKDPFNARSPRPRLTERSVHLLFASAMALGYYDFALELAAGTWADGRESARIRQLVHRWAHRSPGKTLQDVKELYVETRRNPLSANVKVGRFIDRRRHLCDYDDVRP